MKKNLLLLSLLVVPFGMSMTACDNGEQEHKVHVWEKGWTFDADNHWLKCSKCDATNFKSPHKYDDGTITTEATATTDGVKTYTCEVCGSTKTAAYSLGENGHSHVWSDAYTGDNDYHWLECISCHEAKVKEAHTWDNGAITTQPTETEEGVKTYTCTVCKKTKTESVPSLGSGHTHEWSTAYASDDNDHWITCASCDQIKDKNAHNWGKGVVTTEATETENGVRTYTCSVCNKTKTEVIPKTGSGSGTGTGTGDKTEVDGYVLVDSIKDTDNLYIVSSADGITYNAMTATIKDATLPWYFNYAVTNYDLTKDGISSMEEGAEQFKFVKQGDGSYIIQTKNGLYLYSYIDGSHYSIGLCNTTAADKGGTVYWNITKKDKGFLVKGTTTNVYLKQYLSFCGDKNDPSWPIYLFQPGKVTVTTGGGSGSNDDYTGTLAEDSRWNLDFTQYGYTFRDTLATLMKAKVTATATYSECLSIGQGAAATRSGYYVPFYHGEEHSRSESANREHTWPNSRGGGDKAGGDAIEKDPYMVRPTLTVDNDARKNKFYGIGSSEWDPASCGFEAARGESARVIFYVATKYGKSHGLSLSNNPGDATSKKTMGTLKYLVEWNRKYPVTNTEKQINNNLEKAGYGRNPFVDHPEYAEFIWTTNGVQTSVPNIDVGGTGTGGNTGGNTGGSTGGNTGGGTTEDNSKFLKVTSLDVLENALIVSTADGSGFFSMTTAAKQADKPFYLAGVGSTLSSDKSECTPIGSNAEVFKFTKQSDGTYTIQSSDNKYLFGYIEKSGKSTYNSIQFTDSVTNTKINNNIQSSTAYWDITAKNDGYVVKAHGISVYLEYYDGRFCGYKSAPSTLIYFYTKNPAEIINRD